jgi:hypothetical protein
MTLKDWLLELRSGDGFEAWFDDAAGQRSNDCYDMWADAHTDAEVAYEVWRTTGGGDAYSAYRAAADREDAAQAAFARGAVRT